MKKNEKKREKKEDQTGITTSIITQDPNTLTVEKNTNVI